MGAIIAVAPPAGWRKWPRKRYYAWLDKHGVDGRRISTNSEYILFRLTVLFRLDTPGVKTKKYPLFYRLHFSRFELAYKEVSGYLAELDQIETGLRNVSIDEIVSPDAYLDQLDFDLPQPKFRKQKDVLWSQLLQNKIALTPLSPADRDFYLGMFRWAFPTAPASTAADLFHYVFKLHRRIARRALKKHRGLLLNL